MKSILCLVLLVPVLSGNIMAQRCGTESPDPNSAFQAWFNRVAANRTTGKVNAIRIIPVAVHVIYRRDNSNHNISDAQIQSQIEILNDDYRGLSGGFDTQIEFCLAGIRRIKSRDHYQVKRGTNDVQAKALSQAPPDRFLNIWIVDELRNEIGNILLGFAQLPDRLASAPATDGVMIADDFFGNTGTASGSLPYNLGRTTTHEVGHWLNLLHTHEQPGCDNPNNCITTGDCCCDTPPQFQSTYGCDFNLNSCASDVPDLPDPVENYMSYSDDACMDRFTSCQSSRMNLCLDSIRISAWNLVGSECPVFRFAGQAESIDRLAVSVHPNPIQPSSLIEIRIPKDEMVSIAVYDAQGRIVSTLRPAGKMKGGKYTEPFPAYLGRGLYFVRVQVGREMIVQRVVLL